MAQNIFRAPDPEAEDARIPIDQLPRCKKDGCGGLTRPHVVWFGEGLDTHVLEKAADELEKCDLCLVVSWRADKTTFSLVWEGLDTLVLEKPADELEKCDLYLVLVGGLTRPHVVWFGEGLDPLVLEKAANELEKCDLWVG